MVLANIGGGTIRRRSRQRRWSRNGRRWWSGTSVPGTSTSSNGGEQDLRWHHPRLHGSLSPRPLTCSPPSNPTARTPTVWCAIFSFVLLVLFFKRSDRQHKLRKLKIIQSSRT